jgi:hypothetical protein
MSVRNEASATLPNGFQVGWSINPSLIDGTVTPNPAAWRIVRWDAQSRSWQDLPRVTESGGGLAWTWFRTRSDIASRSDDQSYWLYAQNPQAAAPADASAQVFDLWDGFATFDGSKWNRQGAVSSLAPGLKLDGSVSGGGSIISVAKFGPGHAVDFRMTVVQFVTGSRWLCGGYQHFDGFEDSQPWLLWISRSSANEIWPEATISGVFSGTGGKLGAATGTSKLYTVERFAKKVLFRYEAGPHYTATASPNQEYTSDLQIRFTSYDGSVIHLGFVRSRMASDPPPTVTLGSEELFP